MRVVLEQVILALMLRGAAAVFALVGLITSPVVASTRLFCRYTGVEIVGCAEQQFPNDAEVRSAACCVSRTVQPLEAAQPAASDRFDAPILVILPVPFGLLAQQSVEPAATATQTAAAGPPAFLSHRALLI